MGRAAVACGVENVKGVGAGEGVAVALSVGEAGVKVAVSVAAGRVQVVNTSRISPLNPRTNPRQPVRVTRA